MTYSGMNRAKAKGNDMKTIVTKVLPATNTKGTRIKATDGHNSVTIGRSYEGSLDTEHAEAAVALISKMVAAGYWKKPVGIATGTLPNGDMVHIMLMDRSLAFDDAVRMIK